MWKLFPLFPLVTVVNFAWALLPPLALDTVLAGALVLGLLTLWALVVAFEGVALASPGPDC
jgi:hypothetical protein